VRVVFDTNVVISAVMSPTGHCRSLTDRAIANEFTLVACPELTAEYLEVLDRPGIKMLLSRANTRVDEFLRNLLELADLSSASPSAGVVTKDSDDDIVVGCALGGRANYIISGDRHLLELNEYRGIQILRPQEMLLLLDALS